MELRITEAPLPDDILGAALPPHIAEMLKEYAAQHGLTPPQLVELMVCFFLGEPTKTFDSSHILIPAIMADEIEGLKFEAALLKQKLAQHGNSEG